MVSDVLLAANNAKDANVVYTIKLNALLAFLALFAAKYLMVGGAHPST